MLALGIVSRLEVEKSEQALLELRTRSAEVYKQIEGADHLITEVAAEEQLAKTRKNTLSPTASSRRGACACQVCGNFAVVPKRLRGTGSVFQKQVRSIDAGQRLWAN